MTDTLISDQPKEKSLDDRIDEVMESVNGNGRFQKFAFFAIAFATNSTGFFYYCFSYLELMPQFTCNYVGSTDQFACEPKDFCDDSSISYNINYDDSRSLYNWVEKLNLICRPQWQIGLLGSSVFIGTVVTFFVPVLSDKYGRKTFFQVGVAINLIAYTFIMVNTSFWVQCVLLFIVGLNSPTTYVIGFGYLQELVGNKHKSIYATLWNLSEGLIFVYSTIYYWKIDRHWFYILSFGYFLNVLSLVGSVFLPESPVFLVNDGRLEEAR